MVLIYRENIESPFYLYDVLQSMLASTWRAEALLSQTAGQKRRLVCFSWPLQTAVFLFMSESKDCKFYFSMELQCFLDLVGLIPQSNLKLKKKIHIVTTSGIFVQIWEKCISTTVNSQVHEKESYNKSFQKGTGCLIHGALYILILTVIKHRVTFNLVKSLAGLKLFHVSVKRRFEFCHHDVREKESNRMNWQRRRKEG